MTDDRAQQCAEEIVKDVCCVDGARETWPESVSEMFDEMVNDYAAIIRKHYPSSWTRIEKDKAETLPPMGTTCLVYFGRSPDPYFSVWTYNGNNQYFRAKPSKTPNEDVTHWQFLPAVPEEK